MCYYFLHCCIFAIVKFTLNAMPFGVCMWPFGMQNREFTRFSYDFCDNFAIFLNYCSMCVRIIVHLFVHG